MKITQFELILTHSSKKTHLLIVSWFYSAKRCKIIYSNLNYLSKIKSHKKSYLTKGAERRLNLSLLNKQLNLGAWCSHSLRRRLRGCRIRSPILSRETQSECDNHSATETHYVLNNGKYIGRRSNGVVTCQTNMDQT